MSLEAFRALLDAGDVHRAVEVARSAGLRVRREDFPTLAQRDRHRGTALGIFDTLHAHRVQQEEAALAALSPAPLPAPGESFTDRAAALTAPWERALFAREYRAELEEEASLRERLRVERAADIERRQRETADAYHRATDPAERRRLLDAMVAIEGERQAAG